MRTAALILGAFAIKRFSGKGIWVDIREMTLFEGLMLMLFFAVAIAQDIRELIR